jgi:hypothetical protein
MKPNTLPPTKKATDSSTFYWEIPRAHYWELPPNAKMLDFASYYVSRDGRTVYSMITGKPLKQILSRGSYQVWLVHKDGTSHWHKVNRLVAQCFVVNYKISSHKLVGYKDGNKLNNHYTNLQWVNYVKSR